MICLNRGLLINYQYLHKDINYHNNLCYTKDVEPRTERGIRTWLITKL